jgi:hypothetical protein
VFSFSGHNCCPVKALCNLKSMQKTFTVRPVFVFSDSKYLSKRNFNVTISSMLQKHIPNRRILGHSFQAGISSALSAKPDLVTPEEIQAWGHWSSHSYKAHTSREAPNIREISFLLREGDLERHMGYFSLKRKLSFIYFLPDCMTKIGIF